MEPVEPRQVHGLVNYNNSSRGQQLALIFYTLHHDWTYANAHPVTYSAHIAFYRGKM